jgi:hypothetical protein
MRIIFSDKGLKKGFWASPVAEQCEHGEACEAVSGV